MPDVARRPRFPYLRRRFARLPLSPLRSRSRTLIVLLRRLLDLLDGDGRRRFVRLVVFLAAVSLLEAAGIGLVLPYLRTVTDAAAVLGHPTAGPLLARLGVDGPTGLMLAASLALVGFFVLKNVFVGWVWHGIYGFLHTHYVETAGRLLRAYLAAPYTFHLQRNTATLIRNATVETDRIFRGNGAVKPAMAILSEALVVTGLVALLVWIHPVAAAAVLGLLGLLGGLLTLLFRRRLETIGRRRSEHEGALVQAVQEGVGGIKEIRLLGREGYFTDRFRRHARPLSDALRQNSMIELLPRLILETGAVVALAGVAAFLVTGGGAPARALPTIGVFTVAIVRLMPSVRRLVHDVNCVRFHGPALETVHEELRSLEPAPGERAVGDGGAGPALRLEERLEVRELGYAYPDASSPALRDVDFTVPAGSAAGIVGATGSGKTTLVNLLLGLLEPTSGRILVDGVDIAGRTPAWQRGVGYIPQDPFLSDDTLRRNVAFGVPDGEIDDGRVERALEAAQLAEFARSRAGGLDVRLGERGAQLSGGQRQRVAIARALYHDPDVLVLDEATSALDYATERRIADTVLALAGDKTLVLVTHRIGTLRGCDALHLLADGELVDSGTFAELEARSERFRGLRRHDRAPAGAAGRVVEDR